MFSTNTTTQSNFESEPAFVTPDESDPETIQFFFEKEVEAIKRMIRGRRKSARFVHDECRNLAKMNG